jgi:hypothetical protein
MQIIEAALAFAITMLVLAMVCSAFVELIHRIFSMREAGLQYMLGQLFDQVLKKHLAEHLAQKNLAKLGDLSNVPDEVKNDAAKLTAYVRNSFVERMSTNRAPMGVPPDATPADGATQVEKNPWWRFGLWSGRDLTTLTPNEFMERLGSIDIGATIKEVNDAVTATAVQAAKDAGAAAADSADAVLKDIAQKFEAFGKEAGAYFEGRARLLSVGVAVVLAFAIHVDAIEMFNTFLRNPAVRGKVIERLDATTAQFKASQDTLNQAQKSAAPVAAPTAPAPAAPPAAPAPAAPVAAPPAQPAPGAQTATPSGQQEVEALKKQLQEALAKTNKTVTDLSDLGVPIGWTQERLDAAGMKVLVYTCPDSTAWFHLGGTCDKDKNILVQVPTALSVYLSLLIGGFLIGLGGPFWYNAISGLTSIRDVAGKVQGSTPQPSTGPAAAPSAPANAPPETPQPTKPVDVFRVSNDAAKS